MQTLCFSNPNPIVKPGQELVNDMLPHKYPTLLVFIIESVAVRQANGHHLGMRDCFREERSVEHDEGDVMVASVRPFRLVSLVNNNSFCAPGTNCYRQGKQSTFV